MRARARLLAPAALALAAAAGGCASSAGPEVLHLEGGRYGAAFDAAVEAARRAGMPPARRDRRGGLIETEPRIAASILEPWRGGNASVGQALANTVAHQRTRARFEFAPAGEGAAADLTAHAGAVELRVRVTVERAYDPTLRRSTWSRSDTTRARVLSPASSATASFWTPVHRDPAFERRLLADVERSLSGGR